jgi:hypothetical protein
VHIILKINVKAYFVCINFLPLDYLLTYDGPKDQDLTGSLNQNGQIGWQSTTDDTDKCPVILQVLSPFISDLTITRVEPMPNN